MHTGAWKGFSSAGKTSTRMPSLKANKSLQTAHRHSQRQDKHFCVRQHSKLAVRSMPVYQQRGLLPVNVIAAVPCDVPASRGRRISSGKQRSKATHCLETMMNPTSRRPGGVLTFQQGLFGQRAQLQTLGAEEGPASHGNQERSAQGAEHKGACRSCTVSLPHQQGACCQSTLS